MKEKRLAKTASIVNQMERLLGQKEVNTLSVDALIEDIIHYYETIISCMPGNVYWLDKNGLAVGCNNNVLDMFGFKSISEFKGLTFEEMGKAGHWSEASTNVFKKDTLEVIHTGLPKLNIEEPPISYDPKLPQYIIGDARRIHRIALELTTNALIFTEKGKISVSVDYAKQEGRELIIKLSVKDSGIGIPEEKQDIIFAQFKRLTPLKAFIRGLA